MAFSKAWACPSTHQAILYANEEFVVGQFKSCGFQVFVGLGKFSERFLLRIKRPLRQSLRRQDRRCSSNRYHIESSGYNS